MLFLNSFIEHLRIFILRLNVVYTVYSLIKVISTLLKLSSTIFNRKENQILHIYTAYLKLEVKKNKGKTREEVDMSRLFQRVSAT